MKKYLLALVYFLIPVTLAIAAGLYAPDGSYNVTISGSQGAIGQLTSQYPAGSTPVGAANVGTTTATGANLVATAGVTNYLCGFAIYADATAATVGAATIGGLLLGTYRIRQSVGALAANTAITTQSFSPCLPASAANVQINLVSLAAGTGGNTAVDIWGYQK